MNAGRPVFAASARSPVLAWESSFGGDMPAAAAAAISPAADPYARWPPAAHLDAAAGSGFSYFGHLYNNSLPPTAYRLQPGCMPNLGQFWPPTPPPDGCGRYDGSNMYLGPHVYRHSENIPSNLRNSYQGLGHYSQMVENSKEPNQRAFKRETPSSPNVNTSNMSNVSSVSKSESMSNLCGNNSKLKPQVSMSNGLPKQETVSVSASSHEPHVCIPDSRSSSSVHPSNEKSCFSPPYSMKNPHKFQNHHIQDPSIQKFKVVTSVQDNCSASPLKNVYFSNIESENVNSVLNKKFKGGEDHFRFDLKNVPLDKLRNTTNFMLHNPYATRKYDAPVAQDCCSVSAACKYRTEKRVDSVAADREQQFRQRSTFCRVKPEKSGHTDCKYERPAKSQGMGHMQDYHHTSSEVFNIPTSMVHSKLEPNDKYFLTSCSSTVPNCMTNSFVNSGPYLLSKDFAPAPGYRGMVYPGSCSLSKPWHVSELPSFGPDNYLRAPEASKPPLARPPFRTPAMHDELVSVAQTAPSDMEVMRMNAKMQQRSHLKGVHDEDDEVQIISVQSKQTHSSKSARHLSERKPVLSPPVSSVTPLCLTTEKETERVAKTAVDCRVECDTQWIKSEPASTVSEQESMHNLKNTSDSGAGRHAQWIKNEAAPVVLQPEEKENINTGTYCMIENTAQWIKNEPVPPAGKHVNSNDHSKNASDSDRDQDVVSVKAEPIPPTPEPEIVGEREQNDVGLGPENINLWIKSEPVPPVLEKEEPTVRTTSSEFDVKDNTLELECASSEPPVIRCEVNPVKLEKSQRESSDNCDMPQIVQSVSEIKATSPNSEESEALLARLDDSPDTSKMPELHKEFCDPVPTPDINDNHNLNLLLNTIEKVASLDITSCASPAPVIIKSEAGQCEGSSRVHPQACGLDLLSVIAGQRLESEFENEDIKSNYPLISNGDFGATEKSKPIKCEVNLDSQKTSVYEMQAKLAELQKKYKQKQKEVSRLKPKKRFTNMFFNGKKKDDSDTISKMVESSNINSLAGEFMSTDHQSKNSLANASKAEMEKNHDSSESGRKLLRKRASDELYPQHPKKQIRTRSLSKGSGKQSKREESCIKEHCHKSVKSSRRKGYQLRRGKSSEICSNHADDGQNLSADDNSSDKSRQSDKTLKSDRKKMKQYSLRHSGQMRKKNEFGHFSAEKVNSLKSMSSKRKSDNPKRYMPAKQGKLSETIIAKQLRNRILFDTSGSLSDDDALDGGVPEELYDALMKCHLEDQNKKDKKAAFFESCKSSLSSSEPRRLKTEDLVLNQRVLTLDDGLFYAGCIRDIQENRYGIMLDGRRGNRLQFYSQEELLTQAIVESKPLSSELPVGTRVCAFWSRDYWCMYPGVVGEASCPSHDWSEPRVFVLFDDGDTAQIATKNIRLIPPDIIPVENDNEDSVEQTQNNCDSADCENNRSKSLLCSTSKTHTVKDCDISVENESKDSSCASVNDSSCDDSCFVEYSQSPSQNTENFTRTENNTSGSYSNDTEANKIEKRQKKRSKRKTGSRTKLKDDSKDKSESKLKRHKKYKEKHHKHHHHHHHHHRHHHHHHHSKKHKHKRKNEKNGPSSNSDKAEIIPFSVNHKSFKACQSDNLACTNELEHSSTTNLPQNDRLC